MDWQESIREREFRGRWLVVIKAALFSVFENVIPLALKLSISFQFGTRVY
jgi:hypothetical protein